jgi:hypothetical protein
MSVSNYLQRDKFPQCCGATILSGFGNTTALAGLKKADWPTKAQIKKFLKDMPPITTYAEGGADHWHEMNKNAFHMAILNDGQKGVLHKIFIDAGFELVASHNNAHSMSQNHLYVRRVEHL